MSFYTSLIFYRPRTPAIVTGPDLASFVSELEGLGITEDAGVRSLSVKFGNAIDKDDRPATWEEYAGAIGTLKEIDWDVDERPSSIKRIATILKRDSRPIYRCHVSLGFATSEIVDQLKREDSNENETDLVLDGWSIELGPIHLRNLSDDAVLHAGWIGVTISGPGYLYPWTVREVVERAEAHPRLRNLVALCRSTWPVPNEIPDPRTQRLRTKHTTHWPYGDVKLEWDWHWGVSETG
jgi:hypothetical protein